MTFEIEISNHFYLNPFEKSNGCVERPKWKTGKLKRLENRLAKRKSKKVIQSDSAFAY